MKSHLISQVLLRRFTSGNKIRVHNIINHSSYLSFPENVAYVDVQDDLYRQVEKKYGYIETRMATAFRCLDKGMLLKHAKHIESVKKFIALHYVRATIFYLAMEKEPEKFENLLIDIKLKFPEKEKDFERSKNIIRQDFRRRINEDLPSLIKSLIGTVEKYIENINLEVAIAPRDVNFLIADIPVSTIAEDGTIGVFSGAALTNSVGMGMPLGLKHFVSLTEQKNPKKYRKLTAKEVGNLNEKLLRQCVIEFYTLP